ncbi:MAG: hypothetical protein GY944_17930 [bacterium]|nr:hypothetical protein [bacterium]
MFDLSDPSWLRFNRGASVMLVVAGSLAIVIWQASFATHAEELDDQFRNRANISGFLEESAPRFFYFLYYTGKFPVVLLDPLEQADWNPEAADRYLSGHPNLSNELHAFLRTGDHAKTLLLYPSAWWNGTPRDVTLAEFNRLFAALSLVSLFVAFAFCHHLLLGSVLVALLGSHPYQLHSLYASNDVFGYTTAFACLCLGLNAPILFTRTRTPWMIAIAIASGVLVATIREVRTEPALVGISIAATYCLAPQIDWRKRAALLVTLVSAFVITTASWSTYWEGKFEEAHRAVELAGGKTYDGPWNRHHVLWHAIWCGLGDFASERGYRWDDRAAYRHAIPMVNQRFGTTYHYRPGPMNYYLDEFYTDQRKHRISPETLDEYNAVIRDHVLDDISSDPLWYLEVVSRRVDVVLTQTTPLRLAAAGHHLGIGFSGYIALALLVYLIASGARRELALIGFAVPASLTTVLVYSADGIAYASTYHVVGFSILVAWGVNALDSRFGTTDRIEA